MEASLTVSAEHDLLHEYTKLTNLSWTLFAGIDSATNGGFSSRARYFTSFNTQMTVVGILGNENRCPRLGGGSYVVERYTCCRSS